MQIIVGVTGGIAAYKATALIRALTELGHSVKVIATANALRFIGAATLEAISHNPVATDLFSEIDTVKHIALAKEADLIIVAPATASFIARYSAGLADDLLLNVLLATKAKVVVAPAMHTEMWFHPATQQNIKTLLERSVTIVEPGEGRLTGDDSGIGRLAETELIVSTALATSIQQDLVGKKFLVVTGGTREALDSVRFIANRSSGKQGIALAESASHRGAEVHVLAINVEMKASGFASVTNAESISDVQLFLSKDLSGFDAIFMPAAIGDLIPVVAQSGKMHITSEENLFIEFKAAPDLVSEVARAIEPIADRPVLVGFTAHASKYEQETIAEAALRKLVTKGLDAIVANDTSDGAVFGADTNSVLILSKEAQGTAAGSKLEVANSIIDFVLPLLEH